MTGLPRLMIAPNGARRTKADHPALPMTLPEIVETAKDCAALGADGLHLHLRDAKGRHVLDAGLYREALQELGTAVPDMALQITTESAGLYGARHQRAVALDSGAGMVSAALREMAQDTEDTVARAFYSECHANGIAVQHILYEASDFDLLSRLLPDELRSDPALQLIFVLGRYSTDQNSTPADLAPFLARMGRMDLTPDWAVCAFGKGETDCLCEASRQGGKMRIGFENSLWNTDGQLALNNAERVKQLLRALD